MSEENSEENGKKWEDLANQALANKDYDKAIEGFEKSLDIYRHLGHRGQVGILRKQIIKIESLKNLHANNKRVEVDVKKDSMNKEKQADKYVSLAKNNVFKKNYAEAIFNYEKALELYEGLGFSFQERKINWEINKIKQLKMDEDKKAEENSEAQLSIAEERAERLRRQQERQEKIEAAKREKAEKDRLEQEQQRLEKLRILKEKKRLEELSNKQEIPNKPEIKKEKIEIPEKKVEEVKKQPIEDKAAQERLKKLALLKAEKEKQEKMFDEAQKLLDEAKNAADNLEFSQAKEIYAKASKMFQVLGWKDQAITIKNEIDVLTEKEAELVKRKKIEEEKARKIREETEAIIRKDEEEKERLRKLKEEEAKKRSPEDQRKIEIAKLNINKGKTSEEKEKYLQAIKRYEVALEIYEEIQYDESEIVELKKMIENIKDKA